MLSNQRLRELWPLAPTPLPHALIIASQLPKHLRRQTLGDGFMTRRRGHCHRAVRSAVKRWRWLSRVSRGGLPLTWFNSSVFGQRTQQFQVYALIYFVGREQCGIVWKCKSSLFHLGRQCEYTAGNPESNQTLWEPKAWTSEEGPVTKEIRELLFFDRKPAHSAFLVTYLLGGQNVPSQSAELHVILRCKVIAPMRVLRPASNFYNQSSLHERCKTRSGRAWGELDLLCDLRR